MHTLCIPGLTSWASGAGKLADFPGAWSLPLPLAPFPSLPVGQDTLGYWLLLGHLQKFSFVVGCRNVCCGPNPARWGGGRGRRVRYQGDGAGQASALQIWSARAHSHGHVSPRKGRSEREGQAHASSTTEPHRPPASACLCGAAAEVRAGPEARRSGRAVCLGSPHPLPSASRGLSLPLHRVWLTAGPAWFPGLKATARRS